jgi:hypothetical protein
MEHSYGGRVSYRGIIPTHPVNNPCGRKPAEYPEKTHDFRESVD